MQVVPLERVPSSEPNLENQVITLEPTSMSVSGKVVDISGGPVIGARVTARLAASERAVAVVHSSSTGEFRLDVSDTALQVTAEVEAYSRTAQSVQPPAADLVLVLAPASTIVGRVIVQGTGTPLAHIPVFAEARDGSQPRQATKTDVDGTFRLSALAAGGYSLRALSHEWRSSDAWVSLGVAQTSDTVLLEATRAVTLNATVSVAGEACRPGGFITGAGPVSFSGMLDEAGRVQVSGLLSGRYEVRVSCEPALPLTEVIEAGHEALVRHWDLSSGLSLRGSVQSASGRPITGALVAVQPAWDERAHAALENPASRLVECTSDQQGNFECAGLVEGQYECLLLDRKSERVLVSVGASGASGVIVRGAASATIRVSIPGVAAQRLSALAVTIEGHGISPATGRLEGDLFVFELMPLGTYRISLAGFAEETARQSVSLDRDGQVIDVTLTAPPDTRIAGYVLDEQGQPVVDAWVRASLAQSISRFARTVGEPVLTDSEGAFSIERLFPGRYDLSAVSALGEVARADVEGGQLRAMLRLVAYGRMSGVVQTSSGEPVPAFQLDCESAEGGRTRVSGFDGRWSLPWLAPDKYHLSVSSSAGAAAQAVVLAPGQSLSLVLMLDEARAAIPER